MKTDTTMLLLLALGAVVICAKQERDRILDWFEGLGWFWQGLTGTAFVLFFMFIVAWVSMPALKQWVR